jgi:glycosyltransferase involved in cell wall biosynthesis
MTEQPLVSCIMPTSNRRRFVAQAIWYFLRQDLASRELIVVDDGADGIADLLPGDERIRYVRLERRLPLGAKRNLACELAGGELIAHWDDDDWIGPDRLRLQVEALLAGDADICGADAVLHYWLERGQVRRDRRRSDAGPRLAGGTLLYRRSAWGARRFPEIDVGEDGAFVGHFPPDRVRVLSDPPWYVAVIHPGSTAARNLADPRWEPRPMEELNQRLDLDQDFYAALRRGGPRVVPARPATPMCAVNLAATFVVYDGYGSMAEYLALGMARAGANVQLVPLHLDHQGLSPELDDLLARSRPEPAAPTLCFTWWGEDLSRFHADTDELFVNTMWESSRLPQDWPARLNRTRAVIVPTSFVRRVFRESGVTVPVEVVPQGIDPEVYHEEPRPERASLTTLMVGVLVARKNVQEGIAAWKRAFAGDPDARLLLKARFGWTRFEPDDPRIIFVDSNETTRGIPHWYRQADVLLALGNEGFGLPMVEAMATGLPVIALDSEGQSDVCRAAAGRVLPVEPARWEPFDAQPYGDCGVRGVPAVEDVAERLAWVNEHREEARAMGSAASAWVLRHRNVWAMGPSMLDAMERHLRQPRRLRRRDVLWAPYEGPARWYVDRLTGVQPPAQLSTSAPDLRATKVLHVHHQAGGFDEGELARSVQQARQLGVRVLVTEHQAGRHAAAWERDAEVLVATSDHDAGVLRARWPGKRVECLPAELGWPELARRHVALWSELDAESQEGS